MAKGKLELRQFCCLIRCMGHTNLVGKKELFQTGIRSLNLLLNEVGLKSTETSQLVSTAAEITYFENLNMDTCGEGV